jgi:hypothetical protein
MIGFMGPPLLKKILGLYLQLDYNFFSHTFSSILDILRIDKSHDRKIFELIFLPLIEITSTL